MNNLPSRKDEDMTINMKSVYMSLVLCGAIIASSVTNAATLLFDDFNDGNDDGWTQQLGTWSVSTGQYTTGTTDDDFYAIRGNSSWSNYTVEADIKMNVWENDVGLVFYSQANNNHIRFTVCGSDAGDECDSPVYLEHGQWEYDSEDMEWGYSHTNIATFLKTDEDLVNDTWYHFKVVIDGDSVSAYVDDVLYASASSLPYSSGQIGLVWDNNYPSLAASFDNVQVSTVPLPAAVWLFGSGLLGLIGFSKRKKAAR